MFMMQTEMDQKIVRDTRNAYAAPKRDKHNAV
jgi:hypothetical protein